MWKLGFTGTRQGMTPEQRAAVIACLAGQEIEEFHHGAAVGADAQFAAIVRTGVRPPMRTIAHPCTFQVDSQALEDSDEVRPAKLPLDRNRDIVDGTHVLLACPAGMEEEQRSGTWATIRYARRIDRPVVICWPDGTVSRERIG